MIDAFDVIGIVVHPRRVLDHALKAIHDWAAGHRAAVVQLPGPGTGGHEFAPPGDPATCDVVIAVGGDGTVLAALHAAAPAGRPVLGIACGSLGALAATTVEQLPVALDRLSAGNWTAQDVPALVATQADAAPIHAINDLVLVRAGAGQVAVDIRLAGEPYVRFAGDGVIASTPLGSTAYTLSAGGPMLAPGLAGLVVTPLAPHGGVCPPLVTPPNANLQITLSPGYGGARIEVDGQVAEAAAGFQTLTFSLDFEPSYAQLVSLGDHEPLLAGLRRRRILLDSPRMLARDDRLAAAVDKACN